MMSPETKLIFGGKLLPKHYQALKVEVYVILCFRQGKEPARS